jgi:uncharacterized membrane protein (UPF0182 family)
MGPTLEASLSRIFGGRLPSTPAPATTAGAPGAAAPPGTGASPADRAAALRAWEAWTRSQEALRRGDWAVYGAEQKRLEDALRSLAESRR